MANYSNELRPNGAHVAQVTCWLQNGSKNPNFDVYVLSDKGRRRTMISPTIAVLKPVTLNPGTIYNLPGAFLTKSISDTATWSDDSVIMTVPKALHCPLFDGGADIRL